MDYTAHDPAPCVTVGESASGVAVHGAPPLPLLVRLSLFFISCTLPDSPTASICPPLRWSFTSGRGVLAAPSPLSHVHSCPGCGLDIEGHRQFSLREVMPFSWFTHRKRFPVKLQVSCRKLSQARGGGQESSGCGGHTGRRGPADPETSTGRRWARPRNPGLQPLLGRGLLQVQGAGLGALGCTF